jgi:hypothetical protein
VIGSILGPGGRPGGGADCPCTFNPARIIKPNAGNNVLYLMFIVVMSIIVFKPCFNRVVKLLVYDIF